MRRSGRRCLLAAGIVFAAMPPAAHAAPGLPRTYDVKRIDSPQPIAGGAFGWGIASADLTGDGEADLLVAQAQTGKGQIFIFDGVTGAHIDTIDPPEKNPLIGGQPADDETLAFVYVETMPDVGSCAGGDGGDTDRICDAATVGPGDGIPEIIAGSRNLKVNATNGAAAPVSADRNIGRAYVFDGATRAVLKRIDMPPADRQAQAAFTGPTASPNFGRLVISLQAAPPCAGDRAENNDVGVGPCPDLPRSVRIGDVNGGGAPDLLVTARNFLETPAQALPGSQCRENPGSATRCTSGKAWVYHGEAIQGSDPQAILETAGRSIQNPESQTGGAEFGGNVLRVGDVSRIDTESTATPKPIVPGTDGAPEFVIAARTLDQPLKNPDPLFQDVGAAFLYNGSDGRRFATLVSPEPQARSQFSGSFNFGRPVGDLGATTNPDILMPAPFQNVSSTDDGRAWAMNAVGGGGGATGSWQFATLSDPTPMLGGNFGGSFTGVGDLVAGPEAPANEVLIGGFGPFDPNTETSNNIVTDLHIMNATTQENLQTIPHPDGSRGDGFGVGLTPMGDLNDDGFLDFSASAYVANLSEAGQGRVYVFTSNNTPLPQPTATPTPAPTATPTPTPTPEPRALKPGRCRNETTGTPAAESLEGTIAGDKLYGLGGDDRIRGFAGADCVAGGRGRDRISGGAGADKLVGGRHADRLRGGTGGDRVYGTSGGDDLGGGDGHDLLAGGGGPDELAGGRDADRLFGEDGRDRLRGGPGRNRLDGGDGRDFIDSRNGRRDVVLCGRGRDTVRADRSDSLNGCERVRRPRRSRRG